MKKIVISLASLVLTMTSVHAFSAFSIIPSKIVTPLIEIYHSKNKLTEDGKMEVRVTAYNKKGELSEGKNKLLISKEEFEKYKKQADAVYRMIPKENPSSQNDFTYQGTGFHIGENLILTNVHVLSITKTNLTECGDFELTTNDQSIKFPCKKVHYCSKERDFCLIEMNPAKICTNFFCTKYDLVEMASRPSLNLKSNSHLGPEVILTAIGNTMGYGIHLSRGRGAFPVEDNILFLAPVRTGNSGGPLLNEDGNVVGVVKAETDKKIGEESNVYNVAEPIESVIKLIRDNLTHDEITLKKFENALIDL